MAFNRRELGLTGAAAIGAALVVPAAAIAETADEENLKKTVAAFYQAYLDADGPKFEMLIADQLSFGHSDGRIEDKRKVIGDIVSKKNIYKKFTFSNETIATHETVGVVRHRLVIEAESDGKPGGANVSILQVWQKQGGNWKLLARQAVPVKT